MKYKVRIKTLTPLHIGSGTELLANFDYLADDQYTYILDQDVIYAQELEEKGVENAQLDKPAGELIAMPSHKRLNHFVRYTLRGTPGNVARLNEQIKDVFGKPYLPGSSLKGAIRNAIMVWAIGKGEVKPRWKALKDGKGSAAENWSKLVFGDEPQYDLLRLLQVTDSFFTEKAAFRFCPVRVFQHEADPGSPVGVEALDSGVIFESEIKIDELTLQYTDPNKYKKEAELLDLDAKTFWLTILPQILQQVALLRLEKELETARAWGWGRSAEKFANLLEIAQNLPENAALLQIGWGGGWDSKTVGMALDDEYIDALRLEYDLGKPPKARRDWKPDLNKPYPNSRRMMAEESVDGKPRPAEALGWVQVSFEALGEPRYPDYWAELRAQANAPLKQEWAPLAYDGPPISRPAPAKKPEDEIPEVPEVVSQKAEDAFAKMQAIWAKRGQKK